MIVCERARAYVNSWQLLSCKVMCDSVRERKSICGFLAVVVLQSVDCQGS